MQFSGVQNGSGEKQGGEREMEGREKHQGRVIQCLKIPGMMMDQSVSSLNSHSNRRTTFTEIT